MFSLLIHKNTERMSSPLRSNFETVANFLHKSQLEQIEKNAR